MKKTIYFGILILTVLGCKTSAISSNNYAVNSNDITTTSTNSLTGKETGKKPYFKANGTEPFWQISISEDKIVYKTPEDSIIMAYSKPIVAMDSNVKMYKVKNNSAEFNIQITQKECTNQMSGEVLPYTVAVEFKKNPSSRFEKINGCGEYITDYRLHDIWFLEELNGIKVNKEDFTSIIPIIEIKTKDKRFSSLLGCNRINGSLFFEKEKIRFINVMSTKMACTDINKEAEFITTLESITSYTIEENKLILSNSSGKKIVLRKID